MKRHEKLALGAEGLVACPVCGDKFPDESTLHMHIAKLPVDHEPQKRVRFFRRRRVGWLCLSGARHGAAPLTCCAICGPRTANKA